MNDIIKAAIGNSSAFRFNGKDVKYGFFRDVVVTINDDGTVTIPDLIPIGRRQVRVFLARLFKAGVITDFGNFAKDMEGMI